MSQYGSSKNVGSIILLKRKDLWINHLMVALDKSFLQLMSVSVTALNEKIICDRREEAEPWDAM